MGNTILTVTSSTFLTTKLLGFYSTAHIMKYLVHLLIAITDEYNSYRGKNIFQNIVLNSLKHKSQKP